MIKTQSRILKVNEKQRSLIFALKSCLPFTICQTFSFKNRQQVELEYLFSSLRKFLRVRILKKMLLFFYGHHDDDFLVENILETLSCFGDNKQLKVNFGESVSRCDEKG